MSDNFILFRDVISNLIYFLIFVLTTHYIYRVWKNPELDSISPNLATTLGVLGTFAGIAMGLYNFNPDMMQESVRELLFGLKFAFMTSIAGMLGSFMMKSCQRIFIRIKDKNDKSEAEETEIINGADFNLPQQLHNLNSLVEEMVDYNKKSYEFDKKAWEKVIAKIDKVENSLIGDGDSTLMTQLQKLRTSLNDKQDKLIDEFRDFAETMAEQNSKAFIQALEEVIRDFNSNLTEQFGENFKQLNQAVEKLVDWQENYKVHVEELTANFEKSISSVNEIEGSMSQISENSNSLIEVSEKLRPLLLELNKKQAQINSGLNEFGKLADKAKESVNTIDDYVDHVSRKVMNDLKDNVDLTMTSMKKQTEMLEKTTQQLNESLENTTVKVTNNIHEMVEKNGNIIREDIEKLDKLLEKELNNALSSLGEQLAVLSEKFVEDYTPLTNQLKKVVNMSKGLR